MAAATMRLDEARRKAEQEGFKEGLRLGETQAVERLAGSLDQARKLIESLGQQSGKLLEGLDPVVFELVFEATCKILGEAAVSRDGVFGVVEQVLAKARDAAVLRLRLNPSDVRLLMTGGLAGTPVLDGVELVPDGSVESGCVIETASGSLDGRLDTQLRAFADCLLASRRQTK